MIHVVEARHVAGHTLWVRFDDGTEGEIDLSQDLVGPVFEPLREVDLFRQLTVHPEFETVVWPNGADLAPEFLYGRLRVRALSKTGRFSLARVGAH